MVCYDSVSYARVNHFDPHHWRAVARYLEPRPGMRILEVGCGRGLLLKRIQDEGADAVGVDANPQAIANSVADRAYVMPGERLDFPDDHFDGLCSMHTIEHIPDIDGALAEMCRVVRPGGTLVMVYPAEPIMGLYAIPSSVILHGTPLRAREIHCHKLTPRRLRARMRDLPVEQVASAFSLFQWPQFTTVLRRR
ncbi:MAG TPA: methyltransferase domain-containing protein [Egibacteraceae bacterium]|nr:methyltransferase domain-containing protein [Egibacteraceae bacterium]